MSKEILTSSDQGKFEAIVEYNFAIPFGVEHMVEVEIGPESATSSDAPDTFSGGVVDDEGVSND